MYLCRRKIKKLKQNLKYCVLGLLFVLSATITTQADTYVTVSENSYVPATSLISGVAHSDYDSSDLSQYNLSWVSFAAVSIDKNVSLSKYYVRIISILKDQIRMSRNVNLWVYSDLDFYFPPIDYYIFSLKKIVI